ncbi:MULTISPECIES: single-stranded-DNA-specific exonuclease RecJ [Nostocales]|uniref:Single-stranded-DNA-specific exonuclease RecJ n=2 Tax=Nostocales TaxID=1161 RepID=A0A0C1QY83_9CYAN|nr:DHH family phosphoesterase [Tolypothrix bouteillei]KAF3886475.1 single-stranded-DNA-specific exonuclease RecJ [Tolypothrix bouteillei VB521301]
MLDRSTPQFSRLGQKLPSQRWQIYPQKNDLAQQLAAITNLPPLINQLLINRGIETPEQAQAFLNLEYLALPSPLDDFPDLAVSLELLQEAIISQEKIAICGDYDADGMTSTALLLRSLRWLGARVNYAIPSRMHEGYGINKRIIEEFHSEGVSLVLTVDNGISAFEPIARARELGLKVIVTDHHDIPQQLPPAHAILNPKLIDESSPYRGVAGVGVAYILAVSLAHQLGKAQSSILDPLLELFTLGTIADLAPLTGVNRHWVKNGLQQLPKSKLVGVQALIQMSGVQVRGLGNGDKPDKGELSTPSPNLYPKSKIQNPKSLKPEDIGFRLGPRINAIGRLADPEIVIELLTTDDMGIALERAMQCEDINRRRQEMCEQIEKEAIAIVEAEYLASVSEDRVLVIVQPEWHHGVIGIVASRLVERYGAPVFIGTYEGEEHIRGSARGIPEFHVFEALDSCRDLLGKFGGHKAAGGFSLVSENLVALRSRLSKFANQCLEQQHLKPLVRIDTQVHLDRIDRHFYQQMNVLEPCGIDNPDPILWTPNVRVIEQEIVGKSHVKLTVSQTVNERTYRIKAIAWRWRDYFPLPSQVDIAYKLRENEFNGQINIELELLGVRLPSQNHYPVTQTTPAKTSFEYDERYYDCGIYENAALPELRIMYPEKVILAVPLGKSIGLLGTSRQEAREVDVSQPQYNRLIQAAFQALSAQNRKKDEA